MESPESRAVLFPLPDCLGSDRVSAGETARRFSLLLVAIDNSLVPLIGTAGLVALYHRSLFLAGRESVSVSGLFSSGVESVDISALSAAIAVQSDQDAGSSARLFLHTFQNLLTQLVGSTLTARLLCSASISPLNDDVAPDSSHA